MSYRVYVNNKQFFGNNEHYAEWDEYLESKGINVNDGCYQGQLDNFMELLEVTEKISLRLEAERYERYKKIIQSISKNPDITLKDALESAEIITGTKSLFDLSNIPGRLNSQKKDQQFNTSLFDELLEITQNGYAFLPYTLFKICEHDLETDDIFSRNGHMNCYKLKPGRLIYVRAS